MVCPYCQFEYSADQPCFCHPPLNGKTDDRNEATFIHVSSEDEPIFCNTYRGNRID
jgi:hypothetical protein